MCCKDEATVVEYDRSYWESHPVTLFMSDPKYGTLQFDGEIWRVAATGEEFHWPKSSDSEAEKS